WDDQKVILQGQVLELRNIEGLHVTRKTRHHDDPPIEAYDPLGRPSSLTRLSKRKRSPPRCDASRRWGPSPLHSEQPKPASIPMPKTVCQQTAPKSTFAAMSTRTRLR